MLVSGRASIDLLVQKDSPDPLQVGRYEDPHGSRPPVGLHHRPYCSHTRRAGRALCRRPAAGDTDLSSGAQDWI